MKIIRPKLENLFFRFDQSPVGDVLKAQQNESVTVIGAQNLAGMQQEYPRTDARKFLHDLKSFHHRLVQ